MRISHASNSSGRAARGLTLLAVGIVLVSAPFAVTSSAQAVPLADKQAQAAALDREVSKLEDSFADLQERHRGAKVDLARVQKRMVTLQGKLERSRAQLDRSKQTLLHRATAVYRDGSGSGQLLEVARAGSFSEFFDKLDAIDRVGTNDAQIINRVRTLAERVARQERDVRAARDRKAQLVRRIDRSRVKMRKVLDEKQAALSSVTAEIRSIMEAQRAAEAARLAAISRRNAAAIHAGGVPASGGGVPAAVGGTSVDAGADTGSGADDGASASPSATSADAAPSSVSIPLPPPSGSAASAAGIAMGKVGAPYVYGAAGPSSFDCSGLVVWAFAQAGRGGLPHSTYSLIGMGVSVPSGQAQVGDLVFTNNAGHMGIYVGGGSFVHAPRTGRTVAVESLANYSVIAIRRI